MTLTLEMIEFVVITEQVEKLRKKVKVTSYTILFSKNLALHLHLKLILNIYLGWKFILSICLAIIQVLSG